MFWTCAVALGVGKAEGDSDFRICDGRSLCQPFTQGVLKSAHTYTAFLLDARGQLKMSIMMFDTLATIKANAFVGKLIRSVCADNLNLPRRFFSCFAYFSAISSAHFCETLHALNAAKAWADVDPYDFKICNGP